MTYGWIKLHRDVQNHWVFKDDKFYKWWTIMLFNANHKDNKITLGYHIHKIEVGQCANSLRTWARLFNCSTKQVEKFFKMLESDTMITRKIIGKGKQSTTLINIVNYTKYQHTEETQSTTQDTTQSTTQETTQQKREVHTTKEYKEYKKDRNKENYILSLDKILLSEIEISDVGEDLKNYFNSALLWQKLFIKNLKDTGAPIKNQEFATFKSYVTPIRLMFERDNVTKEQMRVVYDFLNSTRGEFWKSNILSTNKLREKFSTLAVKALSKNHIKNSNDNENSDYKGNR